MFNPEQLSSASHLDFRISRRHLLSLGFAAAATVLLPKVAKAEEWIYAAKRPSQPGYFFPLRRATAIAMGMSTIYQVGGALDTLDIASDNLLGIKTHFRQQGEELAAYYDNNFFDNPKFNRHPLAKAYERSIGFCHGIVHVLILEGKLPADQTRAGILAAQHSGDKLYQPGLSQLTEDLKLKAISFAIQTITLKDGIWTNAVVGVSADGTKLLTTTAGRDLKIVYASQVKDNDVYYPVAPGQENKFPASKVKLAIDDPKALPLWTFNPNERLVNHLANEVPL